MGVRSGSEAAEAGVEVWVCTRIGREEKERKKRRRRRSTASVDASKEPQSFDRGKKEAFSR